MRIALSIAIAFSIASGAGTYAYLDAKTVTVGGDRTLRHPAHERTWHSTREIPLRREAP